MIAVAVGVIAENFDHPAMTDAIMGAFFNHAPEFLTQRLELDNSQFNLCQMAVGDVIGGRATHLRIVGQFEQFPDFLNAEAQFASVANEFEAARAFGTINPMPAFGTLKRADQANFLIVSDGLNLGGRCLGKLANCNSRHRIFLLNLQWLEVVA